MNWNCSTPTKVVNAINTSVKNAVKLEPNMVVMGKREYSTAEYKYPCKITGQKSGLPLDEKLDDDTYPLNSDNVSLVGVETIISGVENLELLQNSQ